jgi:hypothetical protein
VADRSEEIYSRPPSWVRSEPPGLPGRWRRPPVRRSHAVLLLQVFAVTLMVFPSDEVIKAVGGTGYVAALVSYLIFLCYAAATLFGLHNPLEHRSPVRIAICALWLATLASYITLNQGSLSSAQQLGAARWIFQLLGVSGIILTASECLRSLEDVRRVMRALVWGGAVAGAVAALQYWARFDVTPHLRVLPGFSINHAAGYVGIGSRGGVRRVSGTAVNPIEFGVTAGMLLPLAVYLAVHDIGRPRWKRYVPVFCIALAIPTSVSRAAILAAGIGLGALIASFSAQRRLMAVGGVLIAVAGVFVAAHGLIGTLREFFFAGTADASIAHRVNNYPFVESLVRSSPWFGEGGGTYSARIGSVDLSQAHIFDNQFLTTAVELGLVGIVALAFFLIWPAVAALVARSRAVDPQLRDLCAALFGAEIAATVCSATFDSLSFPMFVNVQALVVGLIGAVWLLSSRQRVPAAESEPSSMISPDVRTRHPVGLGAAQGSGGI